MPTSSSMRRSPAPATTASWRDFSMNSASPGKNPFTPRGFSVKMPSFDGRLRRCRPCRRRGRGKNGRADRNTFKVAAQTMEETVDGQVPSPGGALPGRGGKVVAELLGSGRPVETLLVSEESAGRWQALLDGAPVGIGIYRLTAREWAALSQDPSPEGVMAVAAILPAVDPACRCNRIRSASAPLSG